jgi:hypothetical protein
MSSVNLVYQGNGWSLVTEALAYDVYRRVGCPHLWLSLREYGSTKTDRPSSHGRTWKLMPPYEPR